MKEGGPPGTLGVVLSGQNGDSRTRRPTGHVSHAEPNGLRPGVLGTRTASSEGRDPSNRLRPVGLASEEVQTETALSHVLKHTGRAAASRRIRCGGHACREGDERPHTPAAGKGRGTHIKNGVSALTVSSLVLLVCVITLMLLKCSWWCCLLWFFLLLPVAANISCLSSLLSVVTSHPLLSPPCQDVLGGHSKWSCPG